MPKKDFDVRARLHGAALELFRERGYDGTTAGDIAARASVTERTFYRYYPDKREVLFDGEARVQAALIGSIANAPPDDGPLDVLLQAFRSFEPMLAESRPYSVPRQAVITATPALHERELAKIAALADVLADALKARGVTELGAVLAARTGVVIFVHATIAWLDDPSRGFSERIDLAACELKGLFVETRNFGDADTHLF